MKKPTKTKLRNKLDKLVGAKVRSLGYCEICGRKEELQWVHFISRGVIKLRYEPKNNGCICAGCHFKGHANPKWMVEQWERIKGKGVTKCLSIESNKLISLDVNWYLKQIEKYGLKD